MNNKNIKCFFVKLTPNGSFFFGRRKYNELGNRQNYYTTSAMYPQQTTILGMLRYQLLLQNGKTEIGHRKLAEVDEETKALIGEASFPCASGYGKILQLSPVFICKDERIYIHRSNDMALDEDEKGAEIQRQPQLKLGNGKALFLLEKESSAAYQYEHYRSKYGFAKFLENALGDKKPIEKVFLEEIIAHNNRSIRGTSLEQGYFKEVKYRMADGYSFGFYVLLSLDGEPSWKLEDNFVKLGGRGGRFKMELTSGKWTEYEAQVKQFEMPGSQRILLLSDACVKEDYYQHCQAVFGGLVSFRNLKTNLSTSNYYSLAKKAGSRPYITDHRYLLERGSVLYMNQLDAIEDIFMKHELFSVIGYNQFIPIMA